MHKLINSAMMPNLAATYRCRPLSATEFAHLLQSAPFESYIGYPETARILEQLSGVEIPLSRTQTIAERGDTLLIARLKYRMTAPSQKGQTKHTVNDFEFAVCEVE